MPTVYLTEKQPYCVVQTGKVLRNSLYVDIELEAVIAMNICLLN